MAKCDKLRPFPKGPIWDVPVGMLQQTISSSMGNTQWLRAIKSSKWKKEPPPPNQKKSPKVSLLGLTCNIKRHTYIWHQLDYISYSAFEFKIKIKFNLNFNFQTCRDVLPSPALLFQRHEITGKMKTKHAKCIYINTHSTGTTADQYEEIAIIFLHFKHQISLWISVYSMQDTCLHALNHIIQSFTTHIFSKCPVKFIWLPPW